MRRYNEGYVLPLVMVVLVILSAFSLSVLAPSVSNLQAQKTSVEHIRGRYNLIQQAEEELAGFNTGSVITSGPDTPTEAVCSFTNELPLSEFLESIVYNIYTPQSAEVEDGCEILKKLKNNYSFHYSASTSDYPKYDSDNIVLSDENASYIDYLSVYRSYEIGTSPFYVANINLDLSLCITIVCEYLGPITSAEKNVQHQYSYSYSVTVDHSESDYTISTR